MNFLLLYLNRKCIPSVFYLKNEKKRVGMLEHVAHTELTEPGEPWHQTRDAVTVLQFECVSLVLPCSPCSLESES